MKKRNAFGLTVLILIFFVYTLVASATSWVQKLKLPDQWTFKPGGNSKFLSSTAETTKAIEERFDPQPLNTTDIFEKDHRWVATLSASKVVTIMATGNFKPSPTQTSTAASNNNFLASFQDIADNLRKADLTLTNLELPVTPNCVSASCTDSRWVGGLGKAGIGIVTLESKELNSMTQGQSETTLRALSDHSLDFTNRNRFLSKDIHGQKMGFLAFNLARTTQKQLIDAVSENAQSADILTISLNSTYELTSPENVKDLKDLARGAIDAGADLVLGYHPQTLSGAEIYRNKLIVYSLGNLLGRGGTTDSLDAAMVRFTFYEKSLVDIEFIPITTEDGPSIMTATGSRRTEILSKIKETTQKIMSE